MKKELLINKLESFDEIANRRVVEKIKSPSGKVVFSDKSARKLRKILKEHDNFKALSLSKGGKKVMR